MFLLLSQVGWVSPRLAIALVSVAIGVSCVASMACARLNEGDDALQGVGKLSQQSQSSNEENKTDETRAGVRPRPGIHPRPAVRPAPHRVHPSSDNTNPAPSSNGGGANRSSSAPQS